MYTIKSRLTKVREGLEAIIAFAPDLRGEFDGVGAGELGKRVQDSSRSIARPSIVALARGRGVPGRTVWTADEFKGTRGSRARARSTIDRSVDVALTVMFKCSVAKIVIPTIPEEK